MPSRVIKGPDAVNNLKTSSLAKWPSRADADNRIEPFCRPGFEPGFHLEPGENIFTIGSCFARNIEKALAVRGFDVVTRRILAGSELTSMFRANILNNYGVPSIYNELVWAFDDSRPFDPELNFFEVMPGRFVDIHLPASIRPASFEETLERRKVITQIVREAATCPVVVMTLGLIEVWFDKSSGLYLNYSPRRALVMKHPDRFELHILSYAETIEYLRKIVDLLKSACMPDQKLLLTVSPVPLTATYTGRDVLVANAVSKSVLRAAADEIVSANDHIDYFPSYESVTMSERGPAWEDDQRHVEADLIDLNIGRMIDAYVRHGEVAGGADIAGVKEKARAMLNEGGRKKAMRLLEPLRGLAEDDAGLAALYVEACLEVGRATDAAQVLVTIPQGWGEWQKGLLAARLALLEGDAEAAATQLNELAVSVPGQGAIWHWLAEAEAAAHRYDDALLALKNWADADKSSGAPMRLAAAIHRATGKPELADKAYRSAIESEDTDQEFALDYAEFLIEEKRLDDAKRCLASIAPENKWQSERRDKLAVFTG
ncbi:MAG: GSCFA domain-containing protein [Hyphomicrobiales bacterium]